MSSKLGVQNIAHTNGTNAMTIDSSGGVLFPNRPAFRAEKRTPSQSITENVTTKITFEHQEFDIANNYDPSTSRFTAPVSGVYNFNVLLRAISNSGTMEYVAIYLYKNGSAFTDVFQMQTSANNMMNSHLGNSVTVQLTASDYVEIHANISGTSPAIQNFASGHRTWFSGFLIG